EKGGRRAGYIGTDALSKDQGAEPVIGPGIPVIERSMRAVKNICLLALPALLLYGCYSFSGASISPDIKTCSVLLFQNRSPLAPPSFSSQLTEALKQKIVNQTALSLNNDGGDVFFEGSVTGFN